MSETQNTFQYYLDEIDAVRPMITNTQRKKLKSSEVDAFVRLSKHLSILLALGDPKQQMEKILIDLQQSNQGKNKPQGQDRKTHSEVVQLILAEQQALQELRNLEANKTNAKKPTVVEPSSSPILTPVGESVVFYSEPLDPTSPSVTKESRESAKQQILKDKEKEDKKTAKPKREHSDELITVTEKPTPVRSQTHVQISPEIRNNLEKHRKTFEALFTMYPGKSTYNNDVSIERNDFLNLIISIGGHVNTDQGKGSHHFVRLCLNEQLLDIEVLEDESQAIVNHINSAHSKGTMTLSWPRKDRGHNRRFLLQGQIKAARQVLMDNGLTPSVFGGQ